MELEQFMQCPHTGVSHAGNGAALDVAPGRRWPSKLPPSGRGGGPSKLIGCSCPMSMATPDVAQPLRLLREGGCSTLWLVEQLRITRCCSNERKSRLSEQASAAWAH